MIQIWAFTRWEKLSRYYQAVEHGFNRELAGNQTGMISAALAQVDMVKIVESDENSGALPDSSEADGDTSSKGNNTARNTLQNAATKMLPASIKRARVKDREMALEALLTAHPNLTVKELAAQVGLGESAVREWRKEKGK